MKRKQIKVLVLDVDGTLTDGKVYIGENGELFKSFNIKDGMGIRQILPKKGIIPIVITGRKSKILQIRCNEIGIEHCFQGIDNKQEVLVEFLLQTGYSLEQCAYMGDDINDLSCMRMVGVIGCPADAVNEVKGIADFIANKNGGEGAVREFIDWL